VVIARREDTQRPFAVGIANADQGREQDLRGLAALAQVAVKHVRVDRQVERLGLDQRPRLLGDGGGRPQGKNQGAEQRPTQSAIPHALPFILKAHDAAPPGFCHSPRQSAERCRGCPRSVTIRAKHASTEGACGSSSNHCTCRATSGAVWPPCWSPCRPRSPSASPSTRPSPRPTPPSAPWPASSAPR